MLPKSVISTLWSYKISELDPKINKKIIISNTLNWGDKPATDWLFKYYGRGMIKKVAEKVPKDSWDKKSLAFWSLILGIKPKNRKTIVGKV